MSKILKTPNFHNQELKEFTAVVNDQYVTVLAADQDEALTKIAALESHIKKQKNKKETKTDQEDQHQTGQIDQTGQEEGVQSTSVKS